MRQVAQRTAAHCESLTNQLQEAKEEILSIGSKRTAAARAATTGTSSQSPSHTAIIQFDVDDPPKSLMSPDQTVSMDNLKMVCLCTRLVQISDLFVCYRIRMSMQNVF